MIVLRMNRLGIPGKETMGDGVSGVIPSFPARVATREKTRLLSAPQLKAFSWFNTENP